MIRFRKYVFWPIVAVCGTWAITFEQATDFGPGSFGSAVFSKDGRNITTIDGNGVVDVWDVAGRRKVITLAAKNRVRCVALSPTTNLLATGGEDSVIELWDRITGTNLATLRGHTEVVRHMAFTADGKIIASSSNDGTVKFWNVENATQIASFASRKIYCNLAFSPDDGTLAYANSHDRAAIILKNFLNGPERVFANTGLDLVTHLAFSPDGNTLATCESGCRLRLWDARTGSEIECENPDWLSNGKFEANDFLVFSPDGQHLAVGNYLTVGIWNVGSGRNISALGHWTLRSLYPLNQSIGYALSDSTAPRIAGVSFTNNGELMAFGSNQSSATLWRLTSVSVK